MRKDTKSKYAKYFDVDYTTHKAVCKISMQEPKKQN